MNTITIVILLLGVSSYVLTFILGYALRSQISAHRRHTTPPPRRVAA